MQSLQSASRGGIPTQQQTQLPAYARPSKFPAFLLHQSHAQFPFVRQQQQQQQPGRARVVLAAAAAAEAPVKLEAKKKPAFPFVRIAGQDDMKLALLLNVVDPGIGGVLVMGDRGTGKSVAVSPSSR